VARLHWRAAAKADLARIYEWLSSIDGANPDRAIQRIEDAAKGLAKRDTGRPGRTLAEREKIVPRTPYLIVYSRTPSAIEILAVFHMSKDR
jgi:plasmid stabilization system protein ParE